MLNVIKTGEYIIWANWFVFLVLQYIQLPLCFKGLTWHTCYITHVPLAHKRVNRAARSSVALDYLKQNVELFFMLCCVVLCYVVLCCVVLCCVVLCCVVLCYVVLCCVMLCNVMLCCAMLCYAMLWCAMLCYVVLRMVHFVHAVHLASFVRFLRKYAIVSWNINNRPVLLWTYGKFSVSEGPSFCI